MDEDEKKQIRIIVVAIVIGTTTINQGLQQIFPLRQPTTGEQSDYGNQQHERRIGELERELAALRASVASNVQEDLRYRAVDEERIRHIVERISEIRAKQKEREDRERGNYGKR